MIHLEKVGYTAEGTVIVQSASLDVRPGECLCILGPSGCGKTTLLETAAGLSRHDSGTVRIDTAKIACAFQDDVLVPWMNALDNVAYALHGDKRSRKKQARTWIERLGLSPGDMPPAMSGGMRRRLNLARAFASQPEVLFLDEPFAFLDKAWQQRLVGILDEVLGDGTAILMSSHQTDMLDGLPCRCVEAKKRPLCIVEDD